MRNKFLFLSLFVINLCFAQFTAKEYDSEEFNQFKASKTYVVLTGDEKFDTELTKSMSNTGKQHPIQSFQVKNLKQKLPIKQPLLYAY
ncbi:hypothetical protein [Flavobacterium davisii]|uniref:Uncharacterized protein n=1 Tax=Flavobacterium columnare TaxID=996 RepID=A0A8G0P6Y6_9FLAO|nr:hypothetical protein [Flavobacterium davisii]QYS89597.1 hypothetical protein JJC05_04840 [Flavobacterium davisii]